MTEEASTFVELEHDWVEVSIVRSTPARRSSWLWASAKTTLSSGMSMAARRCLPCFPAGNIRWRRPPFILRSPFLSVLPEPLDKSTALRLLAQLACVMHACVMCGDSGSAELFLAQRQCGCCDSRSVRRQPELMQRPAVGRLGLRRSRPCTTSTASRNWWVQSLTIRDHRSAASLRSCIRTMTICKIECIIITMHINEIYHISCTMYRWKFEIYRNFSSNRAKTNIKMNGNFRLDQPNKASEVNGPWKAMTEALTSVEHDWDVVSYSGWPGAILGSVWYNSALPVN